MALADTYMLRDVQKFENEELMNVYFYQDVSLASSASELVTLFTDLMLPDIRNIQTSQVEHVLIDAVNLGDNSNFHESKISVLGEITNSPLPAHDAVNFSLRINSRALRPGSKRFCGIAEEFTTGNFITNSGYIAVLETLRAQLHATLISGSTEVFVPVVVKRVKYLPPGASAPNYAYRLPETDAEFVTGDIVEVLVNLRVSHQVSRNNGR
jgi:hypothetical protein